MADPTCTIIVTAARPNHAGRITAAGKSCPGHGAAARETYLYDPFHYLLLASHLHFQAEILEATINRPGSAG